MITNDNGGDNNDKCEEDNVEDGDGRNNDIDNTVDANYNWCYHHYLEGNDDSNANWWW